jgi:hypothetical protein
MFGFKIVSRLFHGCIKNNYFGTIWNHFGTKLEMDVYSRNDFYLELTNINQ